MKPSKRKLADAMARALVAQIKDPHRMSHMKRHLKLVAAYRRAIN